MKLNLGCGTDIRDGYLNVDIQNFPGVDRVQDIRDLSFVQDGSVEWILLQNVLEYIPRSDFLNVIKSCYAKLQDGGLCEIRITDIEKLTKALYMNTISGEMGLHHEMVISLLYGRQANQFDVRYNGFTAKFLEGVLVSQGFVIQSISSDGYDSILRARK